MFVDMEEQYDKIYRYCYFRLRSRQAAEDITQETFLRYLEKYQCVQCDQCDRRMASVQALKCLYTIARNLCVDEYRRRSKELLWEVGSTLRDEPANDLMPKHMMPENTDEQLLTSLAVRAAVAALGQEEQELLLLRYVNEVPILTLAQLLGISRFAVYRRLMLVTKRFQEALRKEGFDEAEAKK